MSLSCPLECEYLQEAHRHEKPIPVPESSILNPDIAVSEELVRRQEELLLFSIYSLVQAGVRTPGATDDDVMAALEALVQTHRTLESGLLYESRPENTVALAIQRLFSASLADYEKVRRDREAATPVRNSELLAILVFLQRIGQQNRNGRPRGRMFLDLLRQMTPEASVEERSPSILL